MYDTKAPKNTIKISSLETRGLDFPLGLNVNRLLKKNQKKTAV